MGNAFAELKAMLGEAAERRVEALTTIGRITEAVTPAKYANYSAAAAYGAE